MTQDEIIRMAREAGLGEPVNHDQWDADLPRLERFANMVAENTDIEQQREIVRLKGIIEEQANGAQNLVAAHEREKQAELEPVGVVEGSGEWGIAGVLVAGVSIGTKLYAAPVRTKDLTDDEIISALGADMDTDEDKEWFMEIARLGIAADREKNK